MMELCRAFLFSIGVVFAMALALFKLPSASMLNRDENSLEIPIILSEDIKIKSRDCQDEEKTYLWKIESQPPAYVFGYLEDQFEKVYETLSSNTKAAFLHSDEVYIQKDNEPKEFMPKLNPNAKWNETVEDLLPADLYRKLEAVLLNVVNASAIRKLRPGWVAFGLHRLVKRAMANDWRSAEKIVQKREFTEGLSTSAKLVGKRVDILKTEHDDAIVSTYNNMPFELYKFWIQETLSKIEFSVPDDRSLHLDKNLEDYKCGQFEGTEMLFIRQDSFVEWKIAAMNLNGYIKNGMVTSKNKMMAARIRHLILSNRNKRLFFAVDAGHLTGQMGTIMDILKDNGFRITRVKKSDSQLDVLF